MSAEAPVLNRATESFNKLTGTLPFFRQSVSRAIAQSSLDNPFGSVTERGKVFVQKQPGVQGISTTLYSFRNEKVFRALTVNGEFKFKPLLRNMDFWKGVLKGKPSVGGEFDDNVVFEYEAGKYFDPEDSRYATDTNRTVLAIEKGEDGEPMLAAVEQHGLLTNPNRKSERLDLITDIYLKKDKPLFALKFALTTKHRGRNIRVNVKKFFAFDQESGMYKSVDAEGLLEEDMPEFLAPATTKDNRRINFANDNGRRVFKLTPNEFSEEQFDHMMFNIIEGRVATTGIWNPLEALPELRKASKPKVGASF